MKFTETNTNCYLKQGIGEVYVMADFICIGCKDRIANENYKIKHSMRFKPTTFRSKVQSAYHYKLEFSLLDDYIL